MLFCRFGSINGVLLPGGGARLSPNHKFYDTAAYLVELTLAANDDNDYFPVNFLLKRGPWGPYLDHQPSGHGDPPPGPFCQKSLARIVGSRSRGSLGKQSDGDLLVTEYNSFYSPLQLPLKDYGVRSVAITKSQDRGYLCS